MVWGDEAEAALERVIAARNPGKPAWERWRAAERALLRLEQAARAIEAGGAAALLDLLSLSNQTAVPLHPLAAAEAVWLAEMAMQGNGCASGKGAPAPLIAHRAALQKRLKWHAVNRVLDDAADYADADTNAVNAWGADPARYAAWQAERADASSAVVRACEVARERLGLGMIEWRAVHVAWKEVGKAHADASTRGAEWQWPGRFYVPTEATMERLGWVELLPLVRTYGACDFPDLFMV